jgi:hypothetical protein
LVTVALTLAVGFWQGVGMIKPSRQFLVQLRNVLDGLPVSGEEREQAAQWLAACIRLLGVSVRWDGREGRFEGGDSI